MADINNSIEYQSRAADLTPNGHPNKAKILSDLGNSHQTRFECLGEKADIDKSIEYQSWAADLTPNGHPNKAKILSYLGNSYQTRFECLGEMADIDKAIESQCQAINFTPNGHPDKPMYLCNLGISQGRRFERLGEMADIDTGIESQCQAIDLTPDGHPSKPGYLSNLGNSHELRFKHLGEMAGVDKAIDFHLQAVNLTPDGHPDKPMYLSHLGRSYQTLFERFGLRASIDTAIAVLEQSATSTIGPSVTRFMAARAWISALRLRGEKFPFRTQGLQPQQTLMNLIPELVWLGAPIHQRFQTIQDVVGSSIHEAVSAAIRAQELELAIEWMEQGRSIVWSQLRRLRSPLADLQKSHPALAQKFQDVQRRIEISFLRHDVHDIAQNTTAHLLEQQVQAHRRDIQKRDDLLAEIRCKQGFESFLQPEKFSALFKACQNRLVALLTVSGENCDALIVLPSCTITHISLTNVYQGDISDPRTRWESSRGTRLSNRGEEDPALTSVDYCLCPQWDNDSLEACLSSRMEEPALLDIEPMTSLLSDLWDKIVYPIVKLSKASLWDSDGERLPRITWCPSGPLSFLPLHAAGIYSSNAQGRIGISDFFVSSYTPSLMALRSNPAQVDQPSILMVTQPNTPNQTPLPGTTVEAKKIMEKATLNGMQSAVLHLPQSEATVSAVMEQLETHGWVHLACHGAQKYPDPMESSFALHDGALTLASLMQKSMGHAQFAFLSACQTATGAQNLPDEAMHLTSGMLAAGFPSVVGTMWSIGDAIAPDVAEAFYATLFEEGRKSDWKVKPEPAYALHFALEKLRKESTGDRDLMKWVPFVHYGI